MRTWRQLLFVATSATLVLAFLHVLAGCHSGAGRTEMIDLKDSLQPLPERFNAERERPRVVAIFSPL